MFGHAGLGEEFKEEATAYAVNIDNRISSSKPEKSAKYVSPYERPILSDRKPLGCQGLAWISVSDRNHHGRGNK